MSSSSTRRTDGAGVRPDRAAELGDRLRTHPERRAQAPDDREPWGRAAGLDQVDRARRHAGEGGELTQAEQALRAYVAESGARRLLADVAKALGVAATASPSFSGGCRGLNHVLMIVAD